MKYIGYQLTKGEDVLFERRYSTPKTKKQIRAYAVKKAITMMLARINIYYLEEGE